MRASLRNERGDIEFLVFSFDDSDMYALLLLDLLLALATALLLLASTL